MNPAAETTAPAGTYGVLTKYLASQPGDEQAWLLLSQVAPSLSEQQRALERVLALNPHNEEAASRLDALTTAAVRTARARRPWQRLARGASWLGLGLAALLVTAVGLASLPTMLGDRTFIVMSGSMEPAIHTGAVVIAQQVPTAALQVGEVMVFSPSSGSTEPTIHRIAGIRDDKGARYFTTQGDANATADVADVSLPPTAWRASYSVPYVGYLVAGANSTHGRLVLIVLPLLALVLSLLSTPVLTLVQRRRNPARSLAAVR
ncbi:MAG: signal peptidase I [Chloroflexota bacterium]